MRYRKRPIEVDAIRWLGGPWACLDDFCGHNWGRADAKEVEYNWDDQEQVVVWNTKERQWLAVPLGHWIIRGVDGELYACDPDVFARTYESIG